MADPVGSEVDDVLVEELVDKKLLDKKDIGLVQRLMARTVVMLLFTAFGFACLELLQYVGRERISNINQWVPELTIFFRAAAIMAWAELIMLWLRVMVQPGVDVQSAATTAETDPKAAAFIYAVHALQWLARILIFLKICELL